MIRKIFFSLLFFIFFIIIGLALVFTFYINSDQFKSELVNQVQKQSGLQIKFNGKVGWNFGHSGLEFIFNNIEVARPLSFDANSSAKAEEVEVYIAWNSLIAGKVKVDKLIFYHAKLLFQNIALEKGNQQVNLNGEITVDLTNQKITIDPFAINSHGIHAKGNITGSIKPHDQAYEGKLNFSSLSTADLPSISIFKNLKEVVEDFKEAEIHFKTTSSQNISGELKAATCTFKVNHLPVHHLSASFEIDNLETVHVYNIKGELANGQLAGEVFAEQLNALPQYKINISISKAELSQLLASAILKGPTDLSLNVTMQGRKSHDLLSSSNGNVKLAAYNGVLNRVDLLKQIKAVRQFLQSNPHVVSDNGTNYSKLTATGFIKNGLFTNNDFLLQSKDLEANGSGTVNLVDQQVNYLVKVKAEVKMLGNSFKLSVPVKITGSLTKPDVSIKNQADTSGNDIGKQASKEFKKLFGH